ncbi:MAG TPA: methylmalonyl-CoA decarboxylase [Gammaproteobacteria bacterium]
MSFILSSYENQVATITMHNLAKHNALSEPMIKEILAAMEGFRTQKARALVLRAPDGVKVWSAGHDVKELPLTRRDPLGWDDPLRMIVREIETFPAPVLAMVEGGVWGGACEVAFACDMIIAESNATFAVTPAKLGVPYNTTGLLNFLHATNRIIVREMAFTAQPISAERAASLGIVNYVVDKAQLQAKVDELLKHILRNAPLSIAVIKEQFRIMESAHSITPRIFERIQGLRRAVYDSNDYREGLTAFLEKRTPHFTGE